MMPSAIACGCLALVIAPIAAVGGIIVAQGVVRTSEPVSEPASAHQLKLDLTHWNDPIEKRNDDAWLHELSYSDRARVNGYFRGDGRTDVAAFQLRVRASGNDPEKPWTLVNCEKSVPDPITPNTDNACHFVIDLSPSTLRDPIEVAVTGTGPEAKRSFSHVFRFRRQTSYSLAWWEALMGI